MGIDLKAGGRIKKTQSKKSRSTNPYRALLVKLYRFLARRTDSAFNSTVLRRLMMARRFQAPISVSRLLSLMHGKEGKIAVVVGTVTDDVRVLKLPKMSVCALRFTENARRHIEKCGGECLTFDQLALRAPTGSNVILLRGPTKSRKQEKFFGKAPGLPKSTSRPRVHSKGRKFEKARGRRASRAYKA
ncbi:60S ribosomal protein L18, putative [Cryptosporidium muris RN66]|uniref:60S ribosomal protein L18, putative n=1 Tax=Cryptosporidium muris (strain RN66) TaxID=441375 RepID=B6AEG7_CRYMR|nr:60S ribosomal protein L18, putative [Cryptosporidium muris RN66]EEA06584.1 60S ribosomal protein L18, putative [Cryptosporidium muris RN66]|eukprot:XP_002140933.1 60S ribosomal protein L18 [Cryptosporidium muris RN66]